MSRRSNSPRPWLMVIVLTVLGALALFSLVVEQLSLPRWLLYTVQVVGLLSIGGFITMRAWRELQRIAPLRGTWSIHDWRSGLFMNLAALAFSVMAVTLGILTMLQPLGINVVVEWAGVAAYLLAAIGLGFGVLSLANYLALNRRDD